MFDGDNSCVDETLGLDYLALTSSDESRERHDLFEKVIGFSIVSDCRLEDNERVVKRVIVNFFHDKLLLMN